MTIGTYYIKNPAQLPEIICNNAQKLIYYTSIIDYKWSTP